MPSRPRPAPLIAMLILSGCAPASSDPATGLPSASPAVPASGSDTSAAPPAAAVGTPPATDAERQALVAAMNGFAADLYARLRVEPGNLAFSPTSIALAFGMTYAGARGDTAAEMARALHLDALSPGAVEAALAELLAEWNDPDRESYRLRVANRLFGDAATPFHGPFLAATRRSYGAELEALDFRGAPDPSRRRINDWIAERTEQRIKDLLPPGSITPDSRLVLANAIYFKGSWLREFDPARTSPAPFHGPGSTREVPMMQQTEVHGYAETDGVQILEMRYAGEELAMLLLLPRKADGLASLEDTLTAETLERWARATRPGEVRVLLPRFRIDPPAATPLKRTLAGMGMRLAFDPGADFTGVSDEKPLYVSDAFHKAFVEVNEEGTEAAAATGVVMATESIRPEPPEFRADHPFLFAIRDLRSGSILFLGRVVDPAP